MMVAPFLQTVEPAEQRRNSLNVQLVGKTFTMSHISSDLRECTAQKQCKYTFFGGETAVEDASQSSTREFIREKSPTPVRRAEIVLLTASGRSITGEPIKSETS